MIYKNYVVLIREAQLTLPTSVVYSNKFSQQMNHKFLNAKGHLLNTMQVRDYLACMKFWFMLFKVNLI